jgi:hypothetical protein
VQTHQVTFRSKLIIHVEDGGLVYAFLGVAGHILAGSEESRLLLDSSALVLTDAVYDVSLLGKSTALTGRRCAAKRGEVLFLFLFLFGLL